MSERTDALMWIRRALQPVVDRLGLRPAARFCFRRLAAWRYGADGLAAVRQNDRLWKYDLDVATRAEVYEPATVAWLRRRVRPADCVLDVGANVGQLTLESAALVGPAGTVIAVEPAPGNVRLLRRHVEANGMADRVRV